MKKILQVLAIDDHAVVLEGYRYIFSNPDITERELSFVKAHDCKSAYEIIEQHRDNPFEIAIIDYSIPKFAEKELYTGEDMAMLIRNIMPNCRIIIMTMHREVDIISSVLQKVKPEGFINKSDCSTEELIEGFKIVISGNTFYSKTVSSFIKRQENGVMLEEVDVRIILLLAKGIKNKNLEKYIPLSASAIEKRKYRIKRLLDVEGDDEDLIKEARIQGYI